MIEEKIREHMKAADFMRTLKSGDPETNFQSALLHLEFAKALAAILQAEQTKRVAILLEAYVTLEHSKRSHDRAG